MREMPARAIFEDNLGSYFRTVRAVAWQSIKGNQCCKVARTFRPKSAGMRKIWEDICWGRKYYQELHIVERTNTKNGATLVMTTEFLKEPIQIMGQPIPFQAFITRDASE